MKYDALVSMEGKYTLAEFPDCPGCQTFAEPGQDIVSIAREALEGWLEAHLVHGRVPPRPTERGRARKGTRIVPVIIAPRLAIALALRWARQDAGLTQKEFAKRMGMSQQQAARLEDPDTNPTVETLERAAAALGAQVELVLVPQG